MKHIYSNKSIFIDEYNKNSFYFKKNAINATYKSIRLAIFCVKNLTVSVGVAWV